MARVAVGEHEIGGAHAFEAEPAVVPVGGNCPVGVVLARKIVEKVARMQNVAAVVESHFSDSADAPDDLDERVDEPARCFPFSFSVRMPPDAEQIKWKRDRDFPVCVFPKIHVVHTASPDCYTK